jgi:predicted nuclease of predicted toxin-antitoxin system
MRVYLDACIDPRVAELLTEYKATTAFQLGWHRLKDHILLPLVQDQFDVFITIDRGFEHEHNLRGLHFGTVIVHVPKNKVEFYRPLITQLKETVKRIRPGEVAHVSER